MCKESLYASAKSYIRSKGFAENRVHFLRSDDREPTYYKHINAAINATTINNTVYSIKAAILGSVVLVCILIDAMI